MSFHISDLKKFNRCPRMFFNCINDENKSFNSYYRMDEEITSLVIKKLNIQDYFLGKKNDCSDLSLKHLKINKYLIKARFEYLNLRVKIPIIEVCEKGLNIKFINVANFPKDDDVMYYVYNIWVLKMLGLKINKISIIHLNRNYVKHEKLDLNELFIESYDFYNVKGNPTCNIKKLIYRRMFDISDSLRRMSHILTLDDLDYSKNKMCTKHNKCEYYDLCFNEVIEDNSILTLVSSQHKVEMLENGRKYLKDVDVDKIEGSKLQYAQILADKNGGLFVDKLALANWVSSSISYPITFIDFEWDTYAIPVYDNLKPFSVVCFEYSVHTLYDDGTLTHKDFIGTQDCREMFLQKLINDVEKVGSVVAFNAEGAEKLRLLELIEQFPKYKSDINKIIVRMSDLSIPFQGGLIYNTKMKGMYSLKVLISAFSDEISYENLKINNGMDAVYNWRMIDRNELSDNEQALKELSIYCGLDTYSMVIIFKFIENYLKLNK